MQVVKKDVILNSFQELVFYRVAWPGVMYVTDLTNKT